MDEVQLVWGSWVTELTSDHQAESDCYRLKWFAAYGSNFCWIIAFLHQFSPVHFNDNYGQIQEMKSFLGLIMVTLIKCLFDICLSFQQYSNIPPSDNCQQISELLKCSNGCQRWTIIMFQLAWLPCKLQACRCDLYMHCCNLLNYRNR